MAEIKMGRLKDVYVWAPKCYLTTTYLVFKDADCEFNIEMPKAVADAVKAAYDEAMFAVAGGAN